MFNVQLQFNLKCLLINSIMIGLFAGLWMDILGCVSAYFFHTPIPLYNHLGQALLAIVSTHHFSMSMNLIIGLGMHFSVAIFDTALFLTCCHYLFHSKPNIIEAISFAWVMMILPIFIEQPLLGLGVAGILSTDPLITELHTLMFHTFFGLGLYIGYYLLNYIAHHLPTLNFLVFRNIAK